MQKNRIGLVAGCFDLIHPGYIKMWQEAKTVCDYLIVALHDDPTIDRPNSHKEKPVHTLAERKMILSSIKWIDEIITYETEADLYKLLGDLEGYIDIRILGSDYINSGYMGDDLEIDVHFHHRNHHWSTTNLKNKIRNQQ